MQNFLPHSPVSSLHIVTPHCTTQLFFAEPMSKALSCVIVSCKTSGKPNCKLTISLVSVILFLGRFLLYFGLFLSIIQVINSVYLFVEVWWDIIHDKIQTGWQTKQTNKNKKTETTPPPKKTKKQQQNRKIKQRRRRRKKITNTISTYN